MSAQDADDVRANPNPGPSISHDFDCTHDPCRCTTHPAEYVSPGAVHVLKQAARLVIQHANRTKGGLSIEDLDVVRYLNELAARYDGQVEP